MNDDTKAILLVLVLSVVALTILYAIVLSVGQFLVTFLIVVLAFAFYELVVGDTVATLEARWRI